LSTVALVATATSVVLAAKPQLSTRASPAGRAGSSAVSPHALTAARAPTTRAPGDFFGFWANFLYGLVPYLVWEAVTDAEPTPPGRAWSRPRHFPTVAPVPAPTRPTGIEPAVAASHAA